MKSKKRVPSPDPEDELPPDGGNSAEGCGVDEDETAPMPVFRLGNRLYTRRSALLGWLRRSEKDKER